MPMSDTDLWQALVSIFAGSMGGVKTLAILNSLVSSNSTDSEYTSLQKLVRMASGEGGGVATSPLANTEIFVSSRDSEFVCLQKLVRMFSGEGGGICVQPDGRVTPPSPLWLQPASVWAQHIQGAGFAGTINFQDVPVTYISAEIWTNFFQLCATPVASPFGTNLKGCALNSSEQMGLIYNYGGNNNSGSLDISGGTNTPVIPQQAHQDATLLLSIDDPTQLVPGATIQWQDATPSTLYSYIIDSTDPTLTAAAFATKMAAAIGGTVVGTTQVAFPPVSNETSFPMSNPDIIAGVSVVSINYGQTYLDDANLLALLGSGWTVTCNR